MDFSKIINNIYVKVFHHKLYLNIDGLIYKY